MVAGRHVDGLLALRDWTISALSGENPSRNEWLDRIAAIPAKTWSAFLKIERCALETRSILTSEAQSLPSSVARVIEDSATTELQRFLSAVGQIRQIAGIARALGTRVVVLKGGVAVVADHPVALDDLDLLVPEADVEALTVALDQEGYSSWGRDTPSTPPTRYQSHSVPIDMHRAIHLLGDPMAVLARARPVASLPGVMQPSAADHLWHLLLHVSHQHPDRRGRIRDLPLLAQAVTQCGPTDLEDVASRMLDHTDPVPLQDHLTMAWQIVRGESITDRFRELAWVKYDAVERLVWLDGGEKARLLRTHVIRSLCANRGLLEEIRDLGDIRPGCVPFLRRMTAFAVAALLARWIQRRQRAQRGHQTIFRAAIQAQRNSV
jgi:hypothetical protein